MRAPEIKQRVALAYDEVDHIRWEGLSERQILALAVCCLDRAGVPLGVQGQILTLLAPTGNRLGIDQ